MTSPAAHAQDTESAAEDGTDLLRRVRALCLEAKVRLLTGEDLWSLPAEPRLGLRSVVMSDGPQGVRGTGEEADPTGLLAAAPSAVAATWDRGLAERVGELFAAEARRKGVHVLLAPLANLQRTPVAGRHFEYWSEDPQLTAVMASGVVRGLQGARVAACLKHFVANESETDRTRYRSKIDERTLREVYLAPFEQVIAEARPWSVMSAYSGLDDGVESAPAAEHHRLLRSILKEEWGFDGPVISDWASARTTVRTALGGLDVVMPGPDGPWGDSLVQAVREGRVPEALVDDKVVRVLRLARRVGRLADGAAADEGAAATARRTHDSYALLRHVAAQSIVVLRDEGGLLPLPDARSVALIGPNAVRPYLQGGGSAYVPTARTVGYEEGLRAALPTDVTLTVRRGGDARMLPPFVDGAHAEDPHGEGPGIRADFLDKDGARIGTVLRPTGDWGGFEAFPADTHRVTLRTRLVLTEPGLHRLEFGCAGRHRCTVDGALVSREDAERGVDMVLDSSHSRPGTRGVDITVEEAQVPLQVRVTADLTVVDAAGYGRFISAHLRHRTPGPSAADEIADAVRAARSADVAVVIVGTNEEVESEGWDRAGLQLPGCQNELVRAVVAANPRTVVVVNAGAPVLLPWAEQVPTLLWGWLPGQEAGHALADVLTGRTEPAGRLPWTLPARAEDVPVPHARPTNGVVDYREGLHIGYRAWDRAGLTPAYPFGHGLGWSAWSYESLVVHQAPVSGEPSGPATGAGDGLNVTVEVVNTGSRRAREVVQVYLEPPAEGEFDRPVRTLAGFAVVEAGPGARTTAQVVVRQRALQVWDPEAGHWRTPPGRYRLHVGRSSRDLRRTTEITVA
ncbi:glycoside hydrolase family 3 C-terminal domain-containing protein [Streptomyces sp. NPDC007084]|uniref:beta-glucosidase family protein n=1 Tax=Streptomyces sp. NPDC007084 TaxID=3154313 RepID=UPI003453115A